MEQYKEIARVCFTNAKQSVEVRETLGVIGLDTREGDLFEVTCHCINPMYVFTPDYVQESMDWWNDFWRMTDFDEFWNKWYNTTERSF